MILLGPAVPEDVVAAMKRGGAVVQSLEASGDAAVGDSHQEQTEIGKERSFALFVCCEAPLSTSKDDHMFYPKNKRQVQHPFLTKTRENNSRSDMPVEMSMWTVRTITI